MRDDAAAKERAQLLLYELGQAVAVTASLREEGLELGLKHGVERAVLGLARCRCAVRVARRRRTPVSESRFVRVTV